MKENSYQIKINNWHKKYGQFSKPIQDKLKQLVEDYDKNQEININKNAIKITPGTRIIREYKGKKYSITVLVDGYEFEGKEYKTLTTIANKITGTKWNGKKFFGVNQ
ncbi:MAG: DUF2924 domain-containing protein [Candidatus Gastranaerophilales bacterium]|nr:DUF2924 domain-containing protein [Candidatus Gastranaerophilales bacterium]